jgi:hypothetical protein
MDVAMTFDLVIVSELKTHHCRQSTRYVCLCQTYKKTEEGGY